jgi:PAS domain S-box-containing protein
LRSEEKCVHGERCCRLAIHRSGALSLTRLEDLHEAVFADLKTAAVPHLHWLDLLPSPLWLMNGSGRLSYVNARFLKYTGFGADEILKSGLESVLHPQDLALWQSAWESATEHRTGLELRLRFRSENGAWRWFRTTALPIESNGQITAWLGMNTDVHAHQISLEELRTLNRYLNVTERLAAKLAGAVTLKAVAAVLAEDSAQTFGAQSVGVRRLEGAETLRLIGTSAAALCQIPRGSALSAALHSKTPVVFGDALDAPWMPPETHSSVHLPLTVNGRVTGLLSLGFCEAIQPNAQWLEWLLSLAHLTAQALERAQLFEETQALNAHLERRVEERTRELMHRTEELESFVYTASHDLRAPLSVLLSAGNVLRDQPTHNDTVTRMAERIERAANRMTQMLSALLSAARTGESHEDAEAMPLNTIIDSVLETLEPQTTRRQATVTVEPELPAVLLPRTAGFQILLNLLQNAIKFAGRPGYAPMVRVKGGGLEAGAPTLLIEDNGEGIPEEAKERLFEPFFTLGDGDSTGMGLTIVQRLLEKNGGRIEFVPLENVPGTQVKLWLPQPVNS